MPNLPNTHQQYSKRQTRADQVEKCLDEGLEPTYYLSIFNLCLNLSTNKSMKMCRFWYNHFCLYNKSTLVETLEMN